MNDWIYQKLKLAETDLEVINNYKFKDGESERVDEVVERAVYDALTAVRSARKQYEKFKGVKSAN